MVLFWLILIILGLLALETITFAEPYFNYLGYRRNTDTSCDNLSFTNCLQTARCGWLADRGGRSGKCYPGTPVGPLNPKMQMNAEDGNTGNHQFDRWIYASPNPFIFC